MSLRFTDYIFLLNFTFKPSQGTFEGFALLYNYHCQTKSPPSQADIDREFSILGKRKCNQTVSLCQVIEVPIEFRIHPGRQHRPQFIVEVNRSQNSCHGGTDFLVFIPGAANEV